MNKDSIIVALAAKAGYCVSGNFSELQRWIREQHHIHIDVQPKTLIPSMDIVLGKFIFKKFQIKNIVIR